MIQEKSRTRKALIDKKKAEKRRLKSETQAQMMLHFVGITNIFQGMNRRSNKMENGKVKYKKFDNLYNFLSNTSLFVQTYGNIQANKGSMTPGINQETVDEISFKKIAKISQEIKNQTSKFSRLRRKWIEKAKLSIGDFEKKNR